MFLIIYIILAEIYFSLKFVSSNFILVNGNNILHDELEHSFNLKTINGCQNYLYINQHQCSNFSKLIFLV